MTEHKTYIFGHQRNDNGRQSYYEEEECFRIFKDLNFQAWN